MAQQDGNTSAQNAVMELFGDEFASPDLEGKPDVEADKNNGKTIVDDRQGETNQDADQNQADGKFRREIDLGDGSGKQVFEADSAEALIDKLTEAQENATRKIRQQQFELRRAQRAKPEKEASAKPIQIGQPKQLSADELFALGQELQTNPGVAFDKILQAQTGMTTDQLKAIGSEFAQIQQARITNEAEVSFLQKHQDIDYLPTAENARNIQKFLQDEGLPYTAANLEYAFQELSESGLLDMPESESSNNDDQKDVNKSQGERIAVQQHTRRRPLSTGLRNSDGNNRQESEKPAKNGLSEAEVEEIYRLPLEEARKKVLAKMRGRSTSGSR